MISTDWSAPLYRGVKIDRNYDQRTFDLSMPRYVEAALQSFNHAIPKKTQHSPYPWTKPTFGAAVQYIEEDNTSDLLTMNQVTHIQIVIGTF